MNPQATFDLAVRFHQNGATIGEVFSFLSGLYFRGKLEYANHFAKAAAPLQGVWIITSDRGLVSQESVVTPDDIRAFSRIPIDRDEKRYLEPLVQSATDLALQLPLHAEVVLLGSVGTSKYATPLLQILNERLKFPVEFVGRGDMSRGGLLLRCIDDSRELDYIPLDGAVVHGKRPPKLQKRRILS